MKTIEESTRILHLPYIREHYKDETEHAVLSDMDHEAFLEGLLDAETLQREQNALRNRIRRARFPYHMDFSLFQTAHLEAEVARRIRVLKKLDFIQNKENIILVGNPGAGKTALSICLGMKACQKGQSVLFLSVPDFLIEIREAMSQNQISRYKKQFCRYDLVILDELGYCGFDSESGEILFNLLSSRNDKGSIIITSNLTVDHWNEIFRDPVLTGAIVDRLAYKAHLLDMTGESYRILATRRWNEEHKQDLSDKY